MSLFVCPSEVVFTEGHLSGLDDLNPAMVPGASRCCSRLDHLSARGACYAPPSGAHRSLHGSRSIRPRSGVRRSGFPAEFELATRGVFGQTWLSHWYSASWERRSGDVFGSVRDAEMIENSVCIFGEQFEHLLVPGDEIIEKLIGWKILSAWARKESF